MTLSVSLAAYVNVLISENDRNESNIAIFITGALPCLKIFMVPYFFIHVCDKAHTLSSILINSISYSTPLYFYLFFTDSFNELTIDVGNFPS